jgi:high-affinity nickel permease
MFGLDDAIASLTDGASFLLVAAAAILLGLRHATDPDHVAAVATIVASGRERITRRAAELGLAWGAGHALTLFAFGLPIVLFKAYLPEIAQQTAETLIGAVIIGLAVALLVRWRRGRFHVHLHEHGGLEHAHVHSHAREAAHRHGHRVRTPLQAFSIGLLHGVGGSAGVGVLLVATIDSGAYGVAALALLAAFTAVSMTVLSTGFGLSLSTVSARRSFHRVAPVLGVTSLAFGVWYALGALSVAPYVF